MSDPNSHEDALHKIHKIANFWNLICDILELVVACLVTIAILISLIKILPGFAHLLTASQIAEAFSEYLEELFSIVIGIEFLKMLCHPNSDNILETLIFLVARHMIINATTPFEDLVSTFTVVMLVGARRYLKHDKEEHTGLHLPLPRKGNEQLPKDSSQE